MKRKISIALSCIFIIFACLNPFDSFAAGAAPTGSDWKWGRNYKGRMYKNQSIGEYPSISSWKFTTTYK